MKYLLFFIIGFITCFGAKAECSAEGISFYPAGKHITPASVFVIEGYFNSQSQIHKIGKDVLLYLSAGNGRIQLKVADLCISDFYLTQAILKPETNLEPGKEYSLEVVSLNKKEPLNQYLLSNEKYKVEIPGKAVDLKFNAPPEIFSKNYVPYGCGPAKSVNFNLNTNLLPALVKATLTNKKNGNATSYYLKPNEFGILEIGHGMCSGAFTFYPGEEYTIRFDLVDSQGNITGWQGKPVEFSWQESDEKI